MKNTFSIIKPDKFKNSKKKEVKCMISADDSIVKGKKIESKCMMCKGELTIIDKQIELGNCGHAFHKSCFNKKQKKYDFLTGNKLKSHYKKCPICRDWNKYRSELMMRKYKSI